MSMSTKSVLAAVAILSMSNAHAVLEVPAQGAWVSGIQTISGWWCNANEITIEFDGMLSAQAAYGTERNDTIGPCGDANNGFGLLFNWNLLGEGQHTVRVLADGVVFAEHIVNVGTLGLGEFATGLTGQYSLPGFPTPGQETTVIWEESTQNFMIQGVQ